MAVKDEQKAAEEAKSVKMENTTSDAKKARETAQNTPSEAKETLVYIGPSLLGGKLKSNKIFVGTRQEVEAELKDVLEQYPMVKHLIVPVGQLAEKKAKSKTPGNILHKYCSDIASVASKKERMG